MGWDNPPVPWREFERRLSWGKAGEGSGEGEGAEGERAEGERAEGERAEVDKGDQGDNGNLARRRIEPALGEEVIPWAELHCHSSYSFLDGASDPDSLIKAAAALGLSAIAITDHDGMYGVPQFAQAATRFRMSQADGDTARNVGTVFGAELSLTRGLGRTGV